MSTQASNVPGVRGFGKRKVIVSGQHPMRGTRDSAELIRDSAELIRQDRDERG